MAPFRSGGLVHPLDLDDRRDRLLGRCLRR